MLCVKCRAELEPDARFCGTCGSAVDKEQRLDGKELLRRASEAIGQDRDLKKAEEIYRKIITDYPSSEEAEAARACLYNIQQEAMLKHQRAGGDNSKSAPRYISTYGTGRTLANLISFIGWLLVLGGVVGLIKSAPLQWKGLSELELALLGASLLIAVWGVLVVAYGQFVRATFDTADFAGEMLALMKSRMK